jgi:hypothetical protein
MERIMDEHADLADAAYLVADEYRDGKLPRVSTSWEATWASLCKELQRRCPGFTPAEYDRALVNGFHASR